MYLDINIPDIRLIPLDHLTYRKVPVVGRINFELRTGSILRFHIILESSIPSTLKMDFGIAIVCMPILCSDLQNLRACFWKSYFHRSIISSMKLPHFKNTISDFKHILHQNWAEKQPFRKLQTSDSTGPFWCDSNHIHEPTDHLITT